MRIKSKCPYCDTNNNHHYTESQINEESYRVVYCDYEKGGCDERYVIDIPFNLEAKSIKIEE